MSAVTRHSDQSARTRCDAPSLICERAVVTARVRPGRMHRGMARGLGARARPCLVPGPATRLTRAITADSLVARPEGAEGAPKRGFGVPPPPNTALPNPGGADDSYDGLCRRQCSGAASAAGQQPQLRRQARRGSAICLVMREAHRAAAPLCLVLCLVLRVDSPRHARPPLCDSCAPSPYSLLWPGPLSATRLSHHTPRPRASEQFENSPWAV